MGKTIINNKLISGFHGFSFSLEGTQSVNGLVYLDCGPPVPTGKLIDTNIAVLGFSDTEITKIEAAL